MIGWSNYVSLSGWGEVLRSLEPVSSTVEVTTRRHNGGSEGGGASLSPAMPLSKP